MNTKNEAELSEESDPFAARLSGSGPVRREKTSEAEQRLRVLFDYAPEAMVMLDVNSGRFVDANPEAEKLFGFSREMLLEVGPIELSPSYQPSGHSLELGREKIAEAVNGGVPVFEWWHRNARGERFPCEVHLVRLRWGNRDVIRGSIVEITERKLLELSEVGRCELVKHLAHGDSLYEILECLVRTIERLLPRMICSVLLLEHETGRLRLGAAPSLPDFYNAAVDGLTIGPTVGSCGAAAFTGKRVVVSDISTHPNWTEFRELAEQAKLKACWSEPIISASGRVLGTFAMYYGETSEPAPLELRAIQAAAQIAADAIELVSSQHSLQEMNSVLERRVAQETKRLAEANQRLIAGEQDARLAAVAFDTHDSIVITDNRGTILRVNSSFTKLTGYEPAEVIGKTPRVLRSGRHGDEFYREMWRIIRAEGYWEGEVWNRHREGQEYLQRLTITSVKNASGETTHFIGDGQDITLAKQADADRAAIQAARTVQRTLFPKQAISLPGFDIAGAVYPAEQVSGDFFDYIPIGEHSAGILVADVSGHGLGPALLMAQTQAYLRALAESCTDPGELLNRANRLFSTSDSGHFVTMFLGRLDAVTRSFVYAGAGHRGYLISRNGSVQVLDSTSMPLGILAILPSSSAAPIALKPGDIVVMPTDGIEESMASDLRLFGPKHLVKVVCNNYSKSADQIVEALYFAARDFAGSMPQRDDITAIVVKVLDA